MDIRARDLLSKIRKVKGAENAIIAGGAVRDTVLGVEPKDFDYFIPAEGWRGVVETLGLSSKVHPDSKEYEDSLEDLKVVRVGEYEGIKFELMDMKIKNDEDFGKNVLKTFDYGLCMIYYEGSSLVRESEEFMDDKNKNQMTLHKLATVSQLPKAIDRFNRINTRLGGKFRFNCPYIKLDFPKDKETILTDGTFYKEEVAFGGFRLEPRAMGEDDVRRVPPAAPARPQQGAMVDDGPWGARPVGDERLWHMPDPFDPARIIHQHQRWNGANWVGMRNLRDGEQVEHIRHPDGRNEFRLVPEERLRAQGIPMIDGPVPAPEDPGEVARRNVRDALNRIQEANRRNPPPAAIWNDEF